MDNSSENNHSFVILNTSEDRYRLLVDNILDYAIYFLDVFGNVATWNNGAQRLKQYEATEITGENFAIFYTPEDRQNNLPDQELKIAIKAGRHESEGWKVRKDGSVFWANIIITPVYNTDKLLIGFSKITRDLSERKKAEDDLYKAYEEIKDSEERYRLIIDGVTDYAIFMLDPAGNVASWNEGARRIKGYEPHEIIGKYFSKFYSREAIQEGFPEYELKEAVRVGRFEDEGWRYRKDGSTFWANVVITAIFNSRKEHIGFSKITRDLTERKKLEQQLFRINEELKENEEKSRLLINSVKDYAILMLNPEGQIISWNAGAERIKGYSAKEIIGKHFSTFYTREAIENNFPQYELSQALENGRFEDEGWRIRKDGNAFWANVIISPIYNSDNRLLGFAKITRDLTERRRNEELMQKNQELLRINNDLDNFVYSASHDLKSPIANMESLLTALREDLGPEEQTHQELLNLMAGSIKTLRDVIRDLSDITKLQQNQGKTENIDIHELVEEVKELLRDTIQMHDAKVELDQLAFSRISYSRKNLRSILFNLISNGIKYADPGRAPRIVIKTYISDAGEQVLSVTDNGLGIPKNLVTQIFSMFKRVHNHVEGTGIGLFLVKRILDNSGDKIEVVSQVGKGSEFKVIFKNKN